MRRVYIASSWRNPLQKQMVDLFREAGHQVYEFKNPHDAEGPFPDKKAAYPHGFHWNEIDPEWEKWDVDEFVTVMEHPTVVECFHKDFGGLDWADIVILLLDCGSSAHLEAGWACGWRDCADTGGAPSKEVYALIPFRLEPELMYLMFDGIAANVETLLRMIE
jgi:hypothetical protein